MRTLLAILTAGMVGVHTLLGCCWHHDHTSAIGNDEHACASLPEHWGAEHLDASHEHESPHRDLCQESPCVFKTVDGPAFDAALQMTVWQPVCADDTAFAGASALSTFEWVHQSTAATIPIRLHLFKGLLLI